MQILLISMILTPTTISFVLIISWTVHNSIAASRHRDARVITTRELAIGTVVPKGPLNLIVLWLVLIN